MVMDTSFHTGLALSLSLHYPATPVPTSSCPQVTQPRSPASLLRPPSGSHLNFSSILPDAFEISPLACPCTWIHSPTFSVSYGIIILSTSRIKAFCILLLPLHTPCFPIVSFPPTVCQMFPFPSTLSPYNAGLTPLLEHTGPHEFSHLHTTLGEPVSVRVQ